MSEVRGGETVVLYCNVDIGSCGAFVHAASVADLLGVLEAGVLDEELSHGAMMCGRVVLCEEIREVVGA